MSDAEPETLIHRLSVFGNQDRIIEVQNLHGADVCFVEFQAPADAINFVTTALIGYPGLSDVRWQLSGATIIFWAAPE